MRQFARFALLAFILAVLTNTPPASVDAAPCAAMNVFVTGTTANPTPVNQNFSNLVACAEDIDNSNIGAAGIFASQIIPTSSTQATFGGSQPYTFTTALTVPSLTSSGAVSGTTGTFTGAVSGATLTSSNTVTGVAANFSSSSNTMGALSLDGGRVSQAGDLALTLNGASNAGRVIFGSSATASGLLLFNSGTYYLEQNPSSPTLSSVNVGALSATSITSGAIQSNSGYVPPSYFYNGTTTSGFHIVSGNITIASPGAGNVNLTGAVTLGGSAVFTTNGTYNVTLTPDLSNGNAPVGWDQYFTSYVVKNSGSEFDVHIYDHGTTTTGATGNGSVDYVAIGY
jgi:hypothetical protein